MIPVAVTRKEYDKAPATFRDAARDGLDCFPADADEAALADAIRRRGARYAVVGVERYRDALYEALPPDGLIARFGVGCDGIDFARARRRGLLCVNTPGALDASVAECAMGLLLLAARRLAAGAAATRRGEWPTVMGVELAGRTLAVAGCGRIGGRVAAMARHGFGMRVTGYDAATPASPEIYDRVTDDWRAAVAEASFVSLHLPATPATEGFLNAERLAALPPGAWIVNTSRGAVVDEDALHDALAGGRLGGAALDVTRAEPYRPADAGRDLRTLENVVITPHLASSTVEACRRMAESALADILRHAAGRRDGLNLAPGG